MKLQDKMDILNIITQEFNNADQSFSDSIYYAVDEVIEYLKTTDKWTEIRKLFKTDEDFAISHIENLLLEYS